MLGGMVESNIVNLPIELDILWVLEWFSTVVPTEVSKVAHLVHPVIKSIGINLGLVGLGQEGEKV